MAAVITEKRFSNIKSLWIECHNTYEVNSLAKNIIPKSDLTTHLKGAQKREEHIKLYHRGVIKPRLENSSG